MIEEEEERITNRAMARLFTWEFIGSAIVAVFVAGGLYAQNQALSDDFNDYKRKVDPADIAVIKNDIDHIKREQQRTRHAQEKIDDKIDKILDKLQE